MSAPSTRRFRDDTQPIPVVSASVVSAHGRHAAPRRHGSLLRWTWLIVREGALVVAVAVGAFLLLRALPGGVVYVSDDAMEPTLSMGDRVVVTTLGSIAPGDVVVVRAPEAWVGPGDVAIARVIALPGERVSCCDASGRVEVNGNALTEVYVEGPGDQVTFDVVVPEGRAFVLADNRATARDSRVDLEADGGSVALTDILGRVVFVAWPPEGLVE
jgi:signal peptidase I